MCLRCLPQLMFINHQREWLKFTDRVWIIKNTVTSVWITSNLQALETFACFNWHLTKKYQQHCTKHVNRSVDDDQNYPELPGLQSQISAKWRDITTTLVPRRHSSYCSQEETIPDWSWSGTGLWGILLSVGPHRITSHSCAHLEGCLQGASKRILEES